MILRRITPSARYTLAVASVAAATLIRILLAHWIGSLFPFFAFYVAVTITAWFGGFGPSLASIALGYLAADLFFYESNVLLLDPGSVLIYFCVTLTITL